MKKALIYAGIILAIAGIVVGWWLPVAGEAPVVLPAYQTGVYIAQGGDKLVAQSGGEIEMQNGSVLDVQSGASIEFGPTVDFDGKIVANSATITSSALVFGTDGLYALGYATDARAIVCGTSDVTGTKTLSSGADTYEYCIATMGEAPDDTALAGYMAWCEISSGDLILHVVDISATVSTESNVAVNWCVVSDTQP